MGAIVLNQTPCEKSRKYFILEVVTFKKKKLTQSLGAMLVPTHTLQSTWEENYSVILEKGVIQLQILDY